MLVPLKDNVLVKPTPSPKVEADGLIIRPDNAGTVPAMSGTVIRVADGPASARKVRDAAIRKCIAIVRQMAGDGLSLDAVLKGLEDYRISASVPSEVQVGDFVTFSSHAGYQTKVDGEDFLLLKADDIESCWQEPDDIDAVAV